MMNETTVLENDEKFIIISKNGKKWQGACCSRVVVKDNLTSRQILCWLNGHLIIDTGVQDKIDLLDYFFIPVEKASVKHFSITKLGNHELLQINHLLASDEDKQYICNCGKWEYFGKKNAIIMFIEHIRGIGHE